MTTPIPSDSRPILWNPNAAANWSLLFTPAFGAYLHARNADSLGREGEARANRVWFYITLGYLGLVLLSIFAPAIPPVVFRIVGTTILLGWYFTLAKDQIKHVKTTCQTGYQRKPWKNPLLIAVGCLLGYLVVSFGLAFIAKSVFGLE